jgi:hypothetical protein
MRVSAIATREKPAPSVRSVNDSPSGGGGEEVAPHAQEVDERARLPVGRGGASVEGPHPCQRRVPDAPGELGRRVGLEDAPRVHQVAGGVEVLASIEKEGAPLGEEEGEARVTRHLRRIGLHLREVGAHRGVERDVGRQSQPHVAAEIGLRPVRSSPRPWRPDGSPESDWVNSGFTSVTSSRCNPAKPRSVPDCTRKEAAPRRVGIQVCWLPVCCT